ncbi:DUF1549 domain-containing protein, partial [Armatimonas sp.]|uniref:DUF1549 domain-containing protein n=1 Tax=Armatimonas sp. TaxID=1872638 RepID=UPI00286C138F
MKRTTVGLLALAGLVATAALAQPKGKVLVPDFNREVRPILADHCLKCHGPDDKKREAGLRLDQSPGTVKLKEMLARIAKPNGDALQMPPTHTNKPLSATQKSILQRWVASGAKYEKHWAFVKPVSAISPGSFLATPSSLSRSSLARKRGKYLPASLAPLPATKEQTGEEGTERGTSIQGRWQKSGSAIDTLVSARLKPLGLALQPEADKYTLIRRVSLDLTGLPPTLEETEAFVKDTRPDAYGKLVDRLLASPHYGERWARKWLDLARYADTNGYEKDKPRTVWPWRDWVIKALNADMPFDQFTVKQLAGDLLPGATLDDRIATGFHRNTMLNEEGGIDPLEFRYYAMVDRMGTTGATWLG